ncbi:MAG: HU family DNA-binding protein [Alphaproteobacteria bacterium]|nr:HU family DNA-binding protein [Alphaproteobacteria bacterium]
MNKTELVDSIAKLSGLTKVDSEKALNATLDAVVKALKENDEVRLVGFGTFAVSKRKATVGRNPRTGKEIKIAACNAPKFKAGKTLKDALN